LHPLLLEAIKRGDSDKVKNILNLYNIKNVTLIKNPDSERLKVVNVNEGNLNDSSALEKYYDTTLWNPILFAIYYKQLPIAKMLIEEY
jgi:hypothetical protein